MFVGLEALDQMILGPEGCPGGGSESDIDVNIPEVQGFGDRTVSPPTMMIFFPAE